MSHILTIFNDTLQGPWKTAGIDVQYKLDHRGVLTFQYTASVSDWLYNFQFWVTPYRDMPQKWYAHREFVALYKSVRDELTPMYKYGLVTRIQGFSQGAALTQIAVEDFFFQVGKPVEAYCFGCPKPFAYIPNQLKNYFSEAFSKTMIFNTKGDIVSMVPPWYHTYGKSVILSTGTWYPSTKPHYIDVYQEGLKIYDNQ
jgi:hypothetical protein